ncbi:MAG: NTPase [Planctomycetes bacterium ADurb.Bin412]|nr:MAG: NTPase [Planctomycetes bacterium ADurb.Bin412]
MNFSKTPFTGPRAAADPLFLWTGPRHAGKTSKLLQLESAARQQGIPLAGLLSLSIYQQGHLTGFDLLDIATRQTRPLARRPQPSVPFAFDSAAFDWGNEILAGIDTRNAHLIILDEFGPLELRGSGWRPAADRLIRTTRTPLLLVVRDGLGSAVRPLYPSRDMIVVPFHLPEAISQVLDGVKRYQEVLKSP